MRIEERWANGDYQALPALAAQLVAKGVVAIAATGDVASARAAQAASQTVPVVFTIGADPVRFGLVASLNRPGGHVTGVSLLTSLIGSKRVDLLRQVAPKISRVALIMNPSNPSAAAEQADAQELIIHTYPFRFVCDIEPDRDVEGRVREFTPQNRYRGAATSRLDSQGNGPFCRFKFPRNLNVSGVYAVIVADQIKYLRPSCRSRPAATAAGKPLEPGQHSRALLVESPDGRALYV